MRLSSVYPLILLCAAGTAFAQTTTPGSTPSNTPPPIATDRPAQNTTDCNKAANRSLAECSQDRAMPRSPAAGMDRGLTREAPRTNDGMSGPNTGSGTRPSDIVDGKKPDPR